MISQKTEKKHNIPTATPVFDATCPFLDESKNCEKCAIYPVRPRICRDFKCDNPKKKIYAESSRTRDVLNVVFMSRSLMKMKPFRLILTML